MKKPILKQRCSDIICRTLMLAGKPHIECINGKEKEVFAFRKGYAIMRDVKKGTYGIIDDKRNVVCDTVNDFCCYYNNGLALIINDNKFGLANIFGRLVCPCKYDRIYSEKYGVRIVRKGLNYGLMTRNGFFLLKCKYTREYVLRFRRLNCR